MNWITQKLNLKDFNSDLAEKISERYGIKQEDIQLIRKGLTPSDVKFDKEEKSSVDYITTRTVDRDREFIIPSGVILDDYRKTPVVLWAHKYDSLPLGKNLWIKADKKGLIAKTQYHTRPGTMGEQVWNYRSDGFPLAKSIGFVPLEIIEKEDYDLVDWKKYGITKEELAGSERAYPKSVLLEYSDVPVPSNPDAIQLAINKGLMNDLVDISALGKAYSLEIVEDENAEVKAAEEAIEKEAGQEGPEAIQAGETKGEEVTDLLFEVIASPNLKEALGIIGDGDDLFAMTKKADIVSKAEEDNEEEDDEEEISCECPECGKEVEIEGGGSCSDMMCPDCEVALGEKGCSGGKRKPKKEADIPEKPVVSKSNDLLLDVMEELFEQRKLIKKLQDQIKPVDDSVVYVDTDLNTDILNSLPLNGITTKSEAIEIAKSILNTEDTLDIGFVPASDFCIMEKSGRVISDKNRRLIQSVIDSLTELIGITNDEPKEEAKVLEIIPEPVFTKEEKTMEVSEEMLTSVVSGTLKELLGLDKATIDLDELVSSRVSYAKGRMTT